MSAKRFLAFALGTFVSILSGVSTSEGALTVKGTLQVRDADGEVGFPGPVDPLLNIKRLDTSGGDVFTNQFTSATGPFGAGAEIRTITASLLGSATDGATFQPLTDNRAGATFGNQLIAISAVLGSITTGGATPTATFTLGRTYIISVTPNTFDQRNPDTWNFAGAFSEFALVGPEAILPGTGEALVFPASGVNTSSTNTSTSTQASGLFLFAEASTGAQNLDPKGGNNWFTSTPVIGSSEGFLAQTFQTTLFENNGTPGAPPFGSPGSGGPGPITASDLLVMNTIFIDMLTKAGSALVDKNFADALGPGPAANFFPDWSFPGGVPTSSSGDFFGQLQTRNSFVAFVPEPSSFAVFGLGLAMAGFWRVVRRRKDA